MPQKTLIPELRKKKEKPESPFQHQKRSLRDKKFTQVKLLPQYSKNHQHTKMVTMPLMASVQRQA